MQRHQQPLDVAMEEQSSTFFVSSFQKKCKLVCQRLGLNQCLLQDASLEVPKIEPPQPEKNQVEDQM